MMNLLLIKVIAIFILYNNLCTAQVKYIVDDFEGYATGTRDISDEGLFSYGGNKLAIDKDRATGSYYSGSRALKVTRNSNKYYGGWGKGTPGIVQLNPGKDYFNFFILLPPVNSELLKVNLSFADDDNGNGIIDPDKDDIWENETEVKATAKWQLISIPLKEFRDGNREGDSVFNINYKEGKLLNVSFRFDDIDKPLHIPILYFDFVCFSQGPLKHSENIFKPVMQEAPNYSLIGAWTDMKYNDDVSRIPSYFLKNVGSDKENKLRVVHFFKPLSIDGSTLPNLYPDVNELNNLLKSGYQPMITLEMQYADVKGVKQPRLEEIISGKFDSYLSTWANTIKKADGKIWIRVFHEFNGNWYPWCIANNNNDPKLFISAFRHIHKIFKQQKADNARFIWCPNSTSFPQESWNYIVDAYPGDEYVDFVGVDIYNGAGESNNWRSFRKEIIESYFLLTENFPKKSFIICEVSSRERDRFEGDVQTKPEWIAQMSEALKNDINKVQLITWFDAKKDFRITSSEKSRAAFRQFIWEDNYFKR